MSDSKNTLLTWAEFSTKEDRPLTSRYLFTMVRPDLQANESTHPGTKWDKDFIQIDRNDIEEWLDFTEGNEMALKLRIPFSKEAVKVSLPRQEGEAETLKRPNFPIYLPAKSMPGMKPSKDVVFVIGETARTVVWDPDCFRTAKDYKNNGRIHLGKVAMYCRAADTCLAFTMTTAGATMFRFFTIDNGDDTERWGVQLVTFPWSPKWLPLPKENLMSGTKAIWASIMMSLDPEGRRIQRRGNLRPLASWPRF
ncbi:hypothetical protein PGQ11_000161 [Apiospora arundinis]